MKRTFILLLAVILTQLSGAQPLQSIHDIDLLLQNLSREEKVQLVVGAGKATTRQGVPTGTIELIKGAAGMTKAIDRVSIPTAVIADGPAGLRIDPIRKDTDRTFYCTGFPVGILLASSWDTDLVREVTSAMGNEVLEYGVDLLLAPGMNIQRNALNGRNFEYFSEDPFLTGKMAAAYVNGVQSNGVGTSIKHFAANNQESNRFNVNSVVSKRALREIYLKGFEIAIKEGKPWTVMSSYNRLNGPFTTENKELLTTILRQEWGFDGLVMTDWTPRKNTVAQIQAGNDLMMPGEADQKEELLAALESGVLSEEDLDACVRRVLEMVAKTPRAKGYNFSNTPDLEAHASLARTAAAESMVLLRNENNTLPLSAGKRVALYGLGAINFIAGGAGSGDVNKPYTVNMVDACKNAGFIVNQEIVDYYKAYRALYEADNKMNRRMLWPSARQEEPSLDWSLINRHAQEEDFAMIVLTRNAWEGGDRPLEGGYLISAEERKLIEDVSSTFHRMDKKVVVVLNVGGVVETASWKELVDAIILPWTPGQEGANAVMDVLTGKVNPSGKLPITFTSTYLSDPSMRNFPYYLSNIGGYDMGIRANRKDFDYTLYEEDIWVGYRYYSTTGTKVSYPFGFGLSYTDFTYSKPKVNKTSDGIIAQITVTNTGMTAGKEAVQVYVSAPSGGIEKPARELKAFGKTRGLNPGESQTLTFRIDNYSLSSFNENESRWETAPGTYSVQFGANVEDIRCSKTISLTKREVWPVHDVLDPDMPMERLSLKK